MTRGGGMGRKGLHGAHGPTPGYDCMGAGGHSQPLSPFTVAHLAAESGWSSPGWPGNADDRSLGAQC